jgi:adenine-specific DNA-methyltransferase
MSHEVGYSAGSALQEAERLRVAASQELDAETRGDLGQFLTPIAIAQLMASMFDDLPEQVRLLDAGAGTGSLSAAFVAEACARKHRPASILVNAFEIDESLAVHLAETLRHCESVCESAGVGFSGNLRQGDFIEAATKYLGASLFRNGSLSHNAAILNPPYRKIGMWSAERCLLQTVGLDATNLYAAFVALSIRLLEPGGQLVVIMPRSFCNGPYFRAFRDQLLSDMTIRRIHLFGSRKDAFRDASVLQENVIVHAVKERSCSRLIRISTGESVSSPSKSRDVAYEDVVRRSNGDSFIHLPTDDGDSAVADWMSNLPASLKDLGVQVSTGRVVDFRAREFLRQDPELGAVPLLYPCHISSGVVRWPQAGSRKPNAIVDTAGSLSLLVHRGYYVLTKRFTSKEERRRVVATVYDPTVLDAVRVGFENHLNYYHCRGASLERDFAFGLKIFLNSTPVDAYFRQFNGHTQVNATDLRSLRYPSADMLAELGRKSGGIDTAVQEAVDAALSRFLPVSGIR